MLWQELMDCTNGCDGGNPLSVFSTILDKPAVETWCDEREHARQSERASQRDMRRGREGAREEEKTRQIDSQSVRGWEGAARFNVV